MTDKLSADDGGGLNTTTTESFAYEGPSVLLIFLPKVMHILNG